MNAKSTSKSIIALLSLAALGMLTACSGGEAGATEPAPTAPAPEPQIIVVQAPKDESEQTTPPTTAAPSTTTPPTTAAPAEQPQVQVDVNIANDGPDVVVPDGGDVIVTPQPPVVVAPRPADPWLIAPGTIEDGTHYGYLVDYSNGYFSFDRADVDPNSGVWTNANPSVRTLPADTTGWYPTLGSPIAVQVVNQHVVDVAPTIDAPYEDWTTDMYEDGDCGC